MNSPLTLPLQGMEEEEEQEQAAEELDDELYSCRGCGQILPEGRAFELGSCRWHVDCFRCGTCDKQLDSDCNLLLLGDYSLICNNCTYSCSACGNKIEDLAILTGDQAYCAGCFRCRNCKKKIKNLRYARTTQGMFCMDCHTALMARRRKKFLRNKLFDRSKDQTAALPSNPKSSSPLPSSIVQPLSDQDGRADVAALGMHGEILRTQLELDALKLEKTTTNEDNNVDTASQVSTSSNEQMSAKSDEALEISSQVSKFSSVKAKSLKIAKGLNATSENDGYVFSSASRTEGRLPTDSGYGTGEHYTSKSSAPALLESMDEEPAHDIQSGGTDADTIYSTTSMDGLSSTEIYISHLANTLLEEIKSLSADRKVLERVCQQLPDLLAAFALRLGSQAMEPIAYQTSAFIYQHRRRIQQLFAEMAIPDEIQEDDPSVRKRYEPKDPFVIQRYLEELGRPSEIDDCIPPSPIIAEDDALPVDQQPVSETIPEIYPYRSLILQSTAFSWLLGSIRRETILTRTSPDVMGQIRAQMFREFPPPRIISRRTTSAVYQVMIKAAWDPITFMRDQQFPAKDKHPLEHAITLTGTPADAQALTAVEYMEQTWPATGRRVLRLVTSAISLRSPLHTVLSDGASLDICFDESLSVNVRGIVDTIVDVIQQIAWLTAALRSSPDSSSVATCTPYIRREGSAPTIENPIAVFSINFTSRKVRDVNPLGGQCWQPMFGNPVLVTGFPIKRRSCSNLGLEMSVNLLPLFTGSNRVTSFNDRICIKGFSAMLVATALTHDMLIWHYICHNNGVSYLDYDGPEFPVSFQQIESARHIIGWCSDCQYRAGTVDAEYNIRGTHLPSPHAGCLLEKVTVSGGQCITVAATVVLGVKDLGPHLKREGYIDTLSALQARYVVLWDESTKRGWLLNGAGALLHMVRAWLQSKVSPIDEEVFDAKKIRDGPHTPDGALKVLTDSQNRQLPLYIDRIERFDEVILNEDKQSSLVRKEKRTYYLFEDLVRRFASILEQMFAHQQQLGGKRGIELKNRIRKHLEGWDFAELVTGRDPTPRVATLHALGYGWVDFIRTISAVTLFGSGFGDIIQPANDLSVCSRWRRLPPDRYYLAASISDLNEIVYWHGRQGRHTQIVEGLIWHTPQDLLSRCACNAAGTSTMTNCDPVQALYPMKSRIAITPRSPQAMLNDKRFEHGAIIFGHNIVFPYRWKHRGNEDLEIGSPDALSPDQAENAEEQVSTDLRSGLRSDESTALPLSLLPTISTSLDSNEGGPSDQSRSAGAVSHSSKLTPPSSVGQPSTDRMQQTRDDDGNDVKPSLEVKAAQPSTRKSRGRSIRDLFTRKSRTIATKP